MKRVTVDDVASRWCRGLEAMYLLPAVALLVTALYMRASVLADGTEPVAVCREVPLGALRQVVEQQVRAVGPPDEFPVERVGQFHTLAVQHRRPELG